MPSHPLSARKTRQVVRAQAETLDTLITKHNGLARDTQRAVDTLTDAVNDQRRAFFGRDFLGRLKFLLTGK